MKTLSITQPWAHLLLSGLKRYETRSWRTYHRGPIFLHAPATLPRWAREFAAAQNIDLAPLPLDSRGAQRTGRSAPKWKKGKTP